MSVEETREPGNNLSLRVGHHSQAGRRSVRNLPKSKIQITQAHYHSDLWHKRLENGDVESFDGEGMRHTQTLTRAQRDAQLTHAYTFLLTGEDEERACPSLPPLAWPIASVIQ